MRCCNIFLGKSGTCKFHGKNVPVGMANPLWKGGAGYKKYLPMNMAARFEELMASPDKLSTEKDVVLLETFIIELLDKMVGDAAIDGLRDAYDDLVLALNGPDHKRDKRLARVEKDFKKWITACNNDANLRKEIKDTMEDKSRIAFREAKRQMDLKLHMTAEEGSAIMMTLSQAVVNKLTEMPHLYSQEVGALDVLTVNNTLDIVTKLANKVKREVAAEMMMLLDHPRSVSHKATRMKFIAKDDVEVKDNGEAEE